MQAVEWVGYSRYKPLDCRSCYKSWSIFQDCCIIFCAVHLTVQPVRHRWVRRSRHCKGKSTMVKCYSIEQGQLCGERGAKLKLFLIHYHFPSYDILLLLLFFNLVASRENNNCNKMERIKILQDSFGHWRDSPADSRRSWTLRKIKQCWKIVSCYFQISDGSKGYHKLINAYVLSLCFSDIPMSFCRIYNLILGPKM